MLENGDNWKLEFFTNTTYPFDLEIHVQLSPKWERRCESLVELIIVGVFMVTIDRHIYRIDGHLIRPYFEKHCLSVYAKRKGHQVTTVAVAVSSETSDDQHRDMGSVTVPSMDPVEKTVKSEIDEEKEEDGVTEREEINYEKEANFMLNVRIIYLIDFQRVKSK